MCFCYTTMAKIQNFSIILKYLECSRFKEELFYLVRNSGTKASWNHMWLDWLPPRRQTFNFKSAFLPQAPNIGPYISSHICLHRIDQLRGTYKDHWVWLRDYFRANKKLSILLRTLSKCFLNTWQAMGHQPPLQEAHASVWPSSHWQPPFLPLIPRSGVWYLSLLLLLRELQRAVRSPLGLLQTGQPSYSHLLLTGHAFLLCYDLFCLLWAHSNIFASFLYCGVHSIQSETAPRSFNFWFIHWAASIE